MNEIIRPERARVEIQEIGVDREEVNTITSKQEPSNKDEQLKNEVKILENTIQKPEILEEEIKEPGCFMDFERDYSRFKANKVVLYKYLKVPIRIKE